VSTEIDGLLAKARLELSFDGGESRRGRFVPFLTRWSCYTSV